MCAATTGIGSGRGGGWRCRGERFRVAPGRCGCLPGQRECAPGYDFPNADVALDNNNTLVPNNKRLNDVLGNRALNGDIRSDRTTPKGVCRC
jgi:hypothetical protein